MGGGRGRTSGSCRYRTPKVHAECSREAPGRESRTTMMRRQMGDIGAIANVCNADLQEPADDSASAGRDEDFHAPTRRYHDISVSVALPLCSHPQIPTHHRVPARRHGRNPELPTQLRAPTAKNAQQPQDATPTRGSRHARRAATPSYGYICRLRCFREAPDIPQAGPVHRHRRPHLPHRQHQPGTCAPTPHSPGTVHPHARRSR